MITPGSTLPGELFLEVHEACIRAQGHLKLCELPGPVATQKQITLSLVIAGSNGLFYGDPGGTSPWVSDQGSSERAGVSDLFLALRVMIRIPMTTISPPR